MAARNKKPTRLDKIKLWLSPFLAWPMRYLNRLVYFLGWMFLSFLLLIGTGLWLFFSSLPDVEQMTYSELRQQAEVRLESKLKKSSNSHHWVELKNINRDLLYAVVMAEDARFFQHQGIDYSALLDAMVANIKKGETRFGGSTLSQQTVKNLFLTPQQSYFRKLQEAFITRNLEQNFSKNEIMELYLNMAEFGPDLYGVGDAARYYFDKKPTGINAAEGAWLALMLPSPRRYHYTLYQNRNVTSSLKRKYQRILQGMHQSSYISSVQYRRYLSMINQVNWPKKT
ncbi:transglycosylase domain-containing protein [Oceanospirillum sp.]|uniref:transglycosylase domain-containing protein n=1 Tax=Oceanospirillum sp. TaxID=2021254 RepID=UPI003A8D7EC4